MFKKKKKKSEYHKNEDEVALLPLLLMDTDKSRANCTSQKTKEIMMKYEAIYCPAGDPKTLGMILFPNNVKRQAFYDEISDFLDLGVGECFVLAKKGYVPKNVVVEAEEFWNTYYSDNEGGKE